MELEKQARAEGVQDRRILKNAERFTTSRDPFYSNWFLFKQWFFIRTDVLRACSHGLSPLAILLFNGTGTIFVAD